MRKEPAPRFRMAGKTSWATRKGPREAMCWAVSKMSRGTCSSSSLSGYLEGRDLPPDKELLEHVPLDIFETAQHIASRGPFLVAQEVLPAMRKRGHGSFLISNNSSSLRGRKRMTGQSLYYPRVMMRTLAQVLTEEYSEHG